MKNNIELQFSIEDKKIVFPELPTLKYLLSCLRNGKYLLTVKGIRKNRTLPQNAYYWGAVIRSISEHTGYEPWEIHEHFKLKYLLSASKPQRVLSTTEISTVDFAEYVDRIIRWAAELYIVIETPEQYYASQ